jgi:hypothetical protein
MHIPDGFLSHGINAATFVISAGACAYGVKKVSRVFGEREVPLMGVTAPFIFAAQMINFPIAGGTSGHFLGAVFSSVLLGPWAGLIIKNEKVSTALSGFPGTLAIFFLALGIAKLVKRPTGLPPACGNK